MSNLFEDIKVGDTVYQQERVRVGWQHGEAFFMPRKVDRVTKAQFILDNGHRIRKEDGRCIGGGGNALKAGDKPYFLSRVVADESDLKKSFEARVNKFYEIRNIVDPREIKINIYSPKLEEIHELALKLKSLAAFEDFDDRLDREVSK